MLDRGNPFLESGISQNPLLDLSALNNPLSDPRSNVNHPLNRQSSLQDQLVNPHQLVNPDQLVNPYQQLQPQELPVQIKPVPSEFLSKDQKQSTPAYNDFSQVFELSSQQPQQQQQQQQPQHQQQELQVQIKPVPSEFIPQQQQQDLQVQIKPVPCEFRPKDPSLPHPEQSVSEPELKTGNEKDLKLIASIDKTTLLRGLVREYIDSQRGILEIRQVGQSETLSEPLAGKIYN